MMSDKIHPHHLQRKALLYVRQSSAHQVLHNREILALVRSLDPLSRSLPTLALHGRHRSGADRRPTVAFRDRFRDRGFRDYRRHARKHTPYQDKQPTAVGAAIVIVHIF